MRTSNIIAVGAPVPVGNWICDNDRILNWPQGEARPSTDGNDVRPDAPAGTVS